MKARYQYRFYPTDQQQQSLAQLFGCVRVVWNDALAMCKQAEKRCAPDGSPVQKSATRQLPGFNKLSALLTQTKKTIERSWLADVSSVPLQQSLRNLDVAYRNFFNSRNGKRKGGKMGMPKFKKKINKQSAEFTKAAFSIDGKNVYLAKIGDLQPIWSRDLPNIPSSVTVIKDCANRYFLSFVVEIEPIYTAESLRSGSPTMQKTQAETKNQSIGIDLGIKTFAVMSNGEKAFSPNYSNTDRKIRKLQRKLARQQKNSKRRGLTRVRIAKLHNKTADTRKDFLHKLSTKLVSENQTIVLEDLNVAGMVKNRKLSRAISQQGWGEFRNLCEAKCEKFGRTFQVISRWAPTSQVCSSCGFRWGKIDLSVRSVVCLNCHTEHDRDENASKNIEMVGTGNWHDLKWTGSDSKTTSVANCDELSRITAASAR